MTKVEKVVWFDPHLAYEPFVPTGGHWDKLIWSEDRLHLLELLGISWLGSVDHQDPDKVILETLFGHQTIA